MAAGSAVAHGGLDELGCGDGVAGTRPDVVVDFSVVLMMQ